MAQENISSESSVRARVMRTGCAAHLHRRWKQTSKKVSAPLEHVSSKHAGEQQGQGRVESARCSSIVPGGEEAVFAFDGRKMASMAAFLLIVADRLVLLTYVEWCKFAHSVVICMEQVLLKSGSRPSARNFNSTPLVPPTALALAVRRSSLHRSEARSRSQSQPLLPRRGRSTRRRSRPLPTRRQ